MTTHSPEGCTKVMRIEDYAERVRPVGVLYVDVHPVAWSETRGLEFLLFRRKPSGVPMPGEWQTVSGKLLADERISEAFDRQVYKKSGLHPTQVYKLNNVATFFDEYYDTVMLVPNAVAVVPRSEVTLDLELHDEYAWLSGEQALTRLSWSNQRVAIEAAMRSLESDGGGGLRLRTGQLELAALCP